MERIKRFLLDESATAEATSTVIMIAAVGILLGLGLTVWYTGVNSFFSAAATKVEAMGTVAWPVPGQ